LKNINFDIIKYIPNANIIKIKNIYENMVGNSNFNIYNINDIDTLININIDKIKNNKFMSDDNKLLLNNYIYNKLKSSLK
jgi:hypothetical protein